jgi:hypothetical protein
VVKRSWPHKPPAAHALPLLNRRRRLTLRKLLAPRCRLSTNEQRKIGAGVRVIKIERGGHGLPLEVRSVLASAHFRAGRTAAEASENPCTVARLPRRGSVAAFGRVGLSRSAVLLSCCLSAGARTQRRPGCRQSGRACRISAAVGRRHVLCTRTRVDGSRTIRSHDGFIDRSWCY